MAREALSVVVTNADVLRQPPMPVVHVFVVDASLALAFASKPKAVFITTVASPATILVASSDDSGIDAGGLLKPALAAAGGRGGGSARLAQGTVPGESALASVVGGLKESTA
jgi:alanyl-tRNA synthetase